MIRLLGAGFCAGVLSVQTLRELPSSQISLLLLTVVFGCLWSPTTRPLAATILGMLWAVWRAQLLMAHSLPTSLEGERAVVQGIVVGLPLKNSDGLRFMVDLASLHTEQGDAWSAPGRVRLFWPRTDKQPIPGERWELVVRLKQPRGFMNPGGFDYEAWLFENGIQATGYVLPDPGNQRLANSGGWGADFMRLMLENYLQRGADQREFQGIITALVMGDQRGISQHQWQVLNGTGTSHLVAISGLHVGMLAGLGYLAGRLAWLTLGRLSLRLAAPRVGALCGFLVALGYAALAGFAVPTLRTVIMIGVGFVGLCWSRPLAFFDLLGLALLAVLLLDPFAGMLAGFWLSFGAVAVILYAMRGRVLQASWWWRFGRVHWIIALGLCPLLLFWFGQNPMLGPLANAVAVPWISFVVVPLALVGAGLLAFTDSAGVGLLNLADTALHLIWPYLEWLAAQDFATWSRSPPPLWLTLAATIGTLFVMAPRGVPGRWLGGVWLAPLIFNHGPGPLQGEVDFTLLDVGQGLAAVAETEQHTLVFDTGAKFSDNFDSGQGVIAPYLRYAGRDHVDLLIVSHGDSDHSGGLTGLRSSMEVRRILSNEQAQLPLKPDGYCADNQSWTWDGVQFEVLNPEAAASGTDNDLSCVLRISTGQTSILLTGDIERAAESRLRARHELSLRANILVLPHHGSNTSSSQGFLEAVGPEYALIPAGYRNRFGFPHRQVLDRLATARISVLNTANEGAIQVRLGMKLGEPRSYRRSARHYWNAVPP